MRFTVDALAMACAVLALVAALLLVDDFTQREMASAGRECRVQMARAQGQLEQFRDWLSAARQAGGQGPVVGKRP